MWIIIESTALITLLISYYLITASSAIVIDKKNHRIIIVHKSPPTIVTFSDLISVDLIVNGGKRITAPQMQRDFGSDPNDVCLKIVIANVENPVYVYFTNAEGKKNSLNFKSPEKSAQSLHKKLCGIINLYSPAKQISVSQSAEFQLRKLSEFRNNIVGQSAS